METEILIPSRLLPKTGQVTSYRDGDDGFYHAGWWRGLSYTANKTRFVVKTIDGVDVVIDNATGLMWPKDASSEAGGNGVSFPWAEAIDWANGLDFAGFTDWRMPNINELLSLIQYDLSELLVYDIFDNLYNVREWTSTTYRVHESEALYIDFGDGEVTYMTKVSSVPHLLCVRGGV